MKYKFRSLFDRDKEFTIESDEPLGLYNVFSLSIKKVDKDSKSYSYDNIDCTLQYSKKGETAIKRIDLDQHNFSGFYMFVETYKKRNAFSIGEPIELAEKDTIYVHDNIALENADDDVKIAFKSFITNNKVVDELFKCFLVAYHMGNLRKNRN